MFDIVIRNGTIVDGSGLPRFRADVGIRGGMITKIGRIRERGMRELDAEGHIVTPGFIDGHTHYDAQVNWDKLFTSSCWQGVTSVVMGNCSFSLAPRRKGGEGYIIRDLERAEELSARAMTTGIKWNWETFPEYLDVLDSLPKVINCASNIGHSALRTWAMGPRAFEEEASEDDVDLMRSQVRDAIRSGAIGFSTTRTKNHRTSDDRPVASRLAAWSEVEQLVDVLSQEGSGIFELAVEDGMRVQDPATRAEVMGRMKALAVSSGVPMTFGLTLGTLWEQSIMEEFFNLVDETCEAGGRMFLQTHSKGLSHVNSFQTHMLFDELPYWSEVRSHPLETQGIMLRQPEVRKRLIEEARDAKYSYIASKGPQPADWEIINVYKGIPPYCTVAELARQRNVEPVEAIIDLALENDFKQFFIQFPHREDPADTLRVLKYPRSVMTFSDSGAHVGSIADSSLQTFFLAYWVRDMQKFTLEDGIRMITLTPARAWGFADRGLLREGMVADINVIDLEGLAPQEPEVAHDLPGGEWRLIQRCKGIKATIVGGQLAFEDGVHTGAVPGKLLRAGQAA